MIDLFAARYRRTAPLGEGGYGEVWEAHDTLSDRLVALKILRANVAFSAARVQLETAALRQRVPGVVELFDDGVEDGRPYLVMERVFGRPFPGREGPCAWADIAGVVTALLETLARVHAAFVVHRDIKPANVLVTDEQQIKLLDFGLAYRTDALTARITEHIELLGTPAYMAPEQVRGTAGERSDLYAVGVMLYEALAGRRPHDGKSLAEILRSQRQRPTPLAQAAPGVPPGVARVVEDLIAYDPEQRPRSAMEVLHRLRGEAAVEAPHFPWIGPQDTLDALTRKVRAGQSVDLAGPRGSGRTRCLLALSQALGACVPIVWLTAGEHAFESLSPLLGSLTEHAAMSLAAVRSHVEQVVRQALGGGAVIMADDGDRIDRATLSVLDACRDAGPIVRVWCAPAAPEGALTLAPLREEHLRDLFAGPDRLLHLREDAARLLFLRTEGLPRRVTEEVTTWVRLGVARWTRNLVVVHRAAIEALESGLLLAAPMDPDPAATHGLSGAQLDLLAWLTLAFPHTDPALLAEASGEPRFRLEAHLEQLAEVGLIERRADGKVIPRLRISAEQRWTEERWRAAHQALCRALPEGAPGRLAHLWIRGARGDGERREIAIEAAALAERLIDAGRLEPAMATLESGLRGLRDREASPEIGRLFGLWVEAAVAAGQPHALDRVLYEICRSEPRTGIIAQLEELCRAALGMGEFSARPLAGAERVWPFADARLERVRLTVRVQAARRLADPPAEEAVLREIAAELPPGDADAEALLINLWGRLRYRQGRFREAAALHREAAGKARSALARTYSNISGAFASMDDFAFAEARGLAARAAEDARALRHSYYEMLAEWTLRTIAYRLDEAGAPDLDLIAASAFVGVKQTEGDILFNEAVVAWRRGERADAAHLAERAYAVLSSINEQQATILSRCLCVALGAEAPSAEIAELCERAAAPLLPGIGVQALALIATAGRLPRGAVSAERVQALADTVHRDHWDKRMDILSVDECLAALAEITGSSAAGTSR